MSRFLSYVQLTATLAVLMGVYNLNFPKKEEVATLGGPMLIDSRAHEEQQALEIGQLATLRVAELIANTEIGKPDVITACINTMNGEPTVSIIKMGTENCKQVITTSIVTFQVSYTSDGSLALGHPHITDMKREEEHDRYDGAM